MEQISSIRLRPTDPEFLNTQAFSSGSVFYDASKDTLVLMDGVTRGGFELLRADLSNIEGGSSGSGTVDFGSRTLTAQAFIGDGSGLTNIPMPAGLATETFVNTAVSTAFSTKATTTSLGTVKVDGVTILIDSNGVISSVGGGGGGGGVDLTAFSVGPEGTASGNGGLAYNNTNGVFTYTPPDLSSYLTSYTETDTLSSVTTRGATTSVAVTINNSLTATSLDINNNANVDGNLTVNTDLDVLGTIYTKNIVNNTTGVPRWTSGSDFIIDAAGDVDVRGSKITNAALPTSSTDVATKGYVDGAASAFNGGTVSGAINITNTTASTNKDTGALIVNGGVGVEGSIYAGDLIYVYDTGTASYSPVLTSASGGYNGGIISGTVLINNSTASTSATTGALRVLGGVGIQGTLNTGPDSFFNGIRFGRGAASGLGSNTNVVAGGGTGNDTPLALNVSGINNIAIGYKTGSSAASASNNVYIGHQAGSLRGSGDSNVGIGSGALTSGSSSSNTAIGAGAMGTATGDTSVAIGHDALIGSGGSGNIGLGYLAGHDLLTGDFNVIIGSNDGATITGSSNNILICDGAGNIRIQVNAFGDVSVLSTTGSTNATTGALIVGGGVGIAGAVNISNNTASSSTTTGSIVTAGGIGAAGNIYAGAFYGDGSNLTGVTASGFAGGTVAGATNFTNNTASTSTITGAVRVTGGVGVQGSVYAANFNGVIVPSGGVAPGANRFVRTEANGYTFVNYINSNTSNNENPAINQFIVQNSSDNYYRKASVAHTAAALQSSMRGLQPVTGGGTITVSASGNVLWSSRFIVISNGFGSTSSTTGYFDITCPTSGTITGVGGHANVTATAAGVPMGAWDALYYILPMGSANTSLAANYRIASYISSLEVPYNWVLLCLRNGDDGVFYFPNGIKLELGQSLATTNSTQTRQLDSLGVGTAPSGTSGEIRASNEVTAYYSSDENLKENIRVIENALEKVRQIQGVMFDWTDEEISRRGGEDGYFVRKHDTGLIAQRVNPVLPEVVARRNDGFLAIKYEKMAGLIIQAINELADQVDEIKKKLN